MSLTPDLPLTPYFSAALYSKALFRIIDVPGLHLIISSWMNPTRLLLQCVTKEVTPTADSNG